MFVLQSKTTEGSRNRKVSFSKWNVIVAQSWESLVFLLAQMEEPDPHHPFVLSRDKKRKRKKKRFLLCGGLLVSCTFPSRRTAQKKKKKKVLPQIPNLFFEGETMQLSRSRTLHVSKIARSNCFLLKRRRRRPLRTGPEVFMRQHSTKQFNHFLSPGFTSELPAPR